MKVRIYPGHSIVLMPSGDSTGLKETERCFILILEASVLISWHGLGTICAAPGPKG